MSAGVDRARTCALGILAAQRVAQPVPVTAAELTALRSELEDRFDEWLVGVTADDDPHGWDFLIERCHRSLGDASNHIRSEVP